MKRDSAIKPKREEDYSEWYLEVVKMADLAEHSPVRGCMVIKPWGYGIWENIQRILNGYFKEHGVENCYFPLLIPLSFFEKEAKHVEGFAKECAVVTHHRLEKVGDKLIPASPLPEPLVIRPTSEMIIGEMFSKWVSSYRDLPLKVNQWANIVRWEMRTRLFLRTTEFLWQEGHTVHASKKSAEKDVLEMLDVYADFATNYLAMPVIKGVKTESERFPGAVETYCIEAMMQDKKSLQAGTSHFLGQNFAKSSEIKFTDEEGKIEYGWTTSWGVATRLIGALVMVHSDDDGLILPPRIAPKQIVILPILHKDGDTVLNYCHKLKEELQAITFDNRPLEVLIDKSDIRSKKWHWIRKGVPIRLEIGLKEVETGSVSFARRDLVDEKPKNLLAGEFKEVVVKELLAMQENILNRAKKFLENNIVKIENRDEFYRFFTPENSEKPEIHGGFALSHFCLDPAIEEKIKEDLNVTVRSIPLDFEKEEGLCIFTGKPSKGRVIFAKSY